MSHLGPIWPNLDAKFDIPDNEVASCSSVFDWLNLLTNWANRCSGSRVNELKTQPLGTLVHMVSLFSLQFFFSEFKLIYLLMKPHLEKFKIVRAQTVIFGLNLAFLGATIFFTFFDSPWPILWKTVGWGDPTRLLYSKSKMASKMPLFSYCVFTKIQDWFSPKPLTFQYTSKKIKSCNLYQQYTYNT